MLAENAFDLVCELDAQTRILYLSPNHAELLGWDIDSRLGTDPLNSIHPDDRQAAARELRKVYELGSCRESLRHQHQDGGWHWFECIGKTYRTAAGETRVVVISRDIAERHEFERKLAEAKAQLERRVEERTAELAQANEHLSREIVQRMQAEQAMITARDEMEGHVLRRTRELSEVNRRLQLDLEERKRVEKQLRESEERFRAIAEANPVPIHISRVDDGMILYGNGRLGEAFGYAPEKMIGRCTTDLYCDPADRQRLLEELHARGHVHDYELRTRRADGSLMWVWVSCRVIVYQGEDAILTGFVDITQQKKDEQRARREYEVLRHMLELQERERQLVAYEIHDGLVQDMTGAVMFLEAARFEHQESGHQETKNAANGLRLLKGAINEGRRMIDGLRPPILDESGVVMAIEQLIADTSNLSSLKVEYNQDVTFGRLGGALENTIYRVVQEALTNVHRHSGSDRVLIELIQRGDRLSIKVQDWGIGFDPKQVPANRYGLAGLRQRARLFGGKAVIDSTPGQGATIAIDLPLTDALQVD